MRTEKISLPLGPKEKCKTENFSYTLLVNYMLQDEVETTQNNVV